MIATAELMLFRTLEGFFCFKEVVRDEDGEIVGISPDDVSPIGESVEELAIDLMAFAKALERPYLDESDLEYEEDDEMMAVYGMEAENNVH